MDSSTVTIFVTRGHGDSGDAIRQTCADLERIKDVHAVEVALFPEISAGSPGFHERPSGPEAAPPAWRELAQRLVEEEAPFVGSVRGGTLIDASGISACMDVFGQHSEVVLAATRIDDGNARSKGNAPRATLASNFRSILDGRYFARCIATSGATNLGVDPVVIVRRAALGPSDIRPEASEWDWLLRLWMRSLMRGSAWCEPAFIAEADSNLRSETFAMWRRFTGGLHEAVELDLLGDSTSGDSALSEVVRHGAELLRRQLQVNALRSESAFTDWLGVVSQMWDDPKDGSGAQGSQLNLEVTVVENGDLEDSAQSTQHLAKILKSGQPRRLAPSNWADNAPLEAAPLAKMIKVSTESGDRVPTVLIRPGEDLQIFDRQQLETLLALGPTSLVSRPVSTAAEQGRSTEAFIVWPGDAIDEVFSSARLFSLRAVRADAVDVADWLPPSPVISAKLPLPPFIIAAPDYTEGHGGVVALHRLCDRLNAIGCDAFIEPLGEAVGIRRQGWQTPLWPRKDFQETIVVYPEIVSGNPFGADRVVRWLLNRPAWFTGVQMNEKPDDLVVSFSPQIAPDVPAITMPIIDPTTFFPKDVAGRAKLLYIGKGTVPETFDRSDMTLITSTWPETREALGSLLRSAAMLYSCDWLTALIGESLMCGTPVVLVGEQSWERSEISAWPGMTWEEGDLRSAEAEVGTFFNLYHEGLKEVDGIARHFVEIVKQHFIDLPD